MSDLGPWEGFAADPRRPDVGALRASDADRDHAAALLAGAYADGRLDAAEHDRRLDLAMGATHLRDFVPLLTDLALPGQQGLMAVGPGSTSLPDLAAVRRATDVATVALVALLVWLAAQGSAAFWWMLWPVCALALQRAASLLRPGERPRGPGGTNRLPQPNDDDRDDD